jgi:nucleotide-binding universal stress UspA family protein
VVVHDRRPQEEPVTRPVLAAVQPDDAYYERVLVTAAELCGERPLVVASIFPRPLQWVRDHYRSVETQTAADRRAVRERIEADLQRLSITGTVEVPLANATRVGDDVVAHAARLNAGVIVLGTHGRTGLDAWVVGSVAEYVVRHAACDVHVVRS